jgi:serine/threonine protein kinase
MVRMVGSLESVIEAALSTSVVEKLVARTRHRAPEAVGPGGRYRLLEHVGGGSSGSVYRAVDTRYSDEHHDEIVAVKLRRGERGRSPEGPVRAARERRAIP